MSTCLDQKTKCCGAQTGTSASAQCVNALKNMRVVRCLSTLPLGPWRTRLNHASCLPKLRRCFRYVSVSVRVFRSEHLENVFLSSFTILLMTNLELVQSCQLQVCGCVEVLLPCRRKCSWQIGMLIGGHNVCSSCCCLLLIVRAFPMFTFCFTKDVFSFFRPLTIRSHSFTFSLVTPYD